MKQLRKNLKYLAMSIPQFAPDFSDAETLDVWVEALRDLPLEQLGQAFATAKKTCDHFPSIAKLRRLATGVSKSEGERKKKAILIAEKVWQQGTMSYSQPVEYSGIVSDVLRLMGGPVRFQQYLDHDHDFVIKRAAEIASGLIEELESDLLSGAIQIEATTNYLKLGGASGHSPRFPPRQIEANDNFGGVFGSERLASGAEICTEIVKDLVKAG